MAASGSSESGQQDAESAASLGTELRTARESQGLTLDELAAELRISAEALQALEEDRSEAIGAHVFAKGYLKQYCARLGLDSARLLAAFDESAGSQRVVVAPSRSIQLRDERQIMVWILAGLALVVVVVFLALWWLGKPITLIG